MTIKGRWRIDQMADYEADYPDMMEPAYILFEDDGSGEFAFGCVTGGIWGAGDADRGNAASGRAAASDDLSKGVADSAPGRFRIHFRPPMLGA